MKWILFSGFITCISLSAISQETHPLPQIFPKLKNGFSQLQNKTYLPKQKRDISFLQDRVALPEYKITELPAGGGVYSLPLDNMPCLVTDMTSVAKIPNAKIYTADLSIPNPYYRSDLFPVLK